VLGRLPEDAVLRLYALTKSPDDLKERLRLSNDDASRISALMNAPEISPHLRPTEQRAMLYSVGAATWRDAVHLAFAKSKAKIGDEKWHSLLDLPTHAPVPKFPVTGKDLIAVGVAPGRAMGAALRQLEADP
jgi:poly(A) polymerase